jgi:ParB family chromosome partitioning protein
MVEKAKAKGRGKKPSGTPRRRKGVKLRPTELGATELALATLPAELEALAAAVRADGGAVLASYREPLGGHTLMLTALPVDKVVPTPFQRDISDAHVRRLTQAMDKTKRFLDPIIAVREQTGDAAYWTPNGYPPPDGAQGAGREDGARAAGPRAPRRLPDPGVEHRKAHNLREKAIGVRRMYVDLAPISDGDEESFALEFEEPALATLGFAYEERGRLSGGAYHSILRKVDKWLPGKLEKAMPGRREHARLLLGYDEAVTEAMAALKARGFNSPYLRTFVVARSNPLRFIKGEPPPIEELLPSMTKRVKGMDVSKIKTEDVARTGGAPESSE